MSYELMHCLQPMQSLLHGLLHYFDGVGLPCDNVHVRYSLSDAFAHTLPNLLRNLLNEKHI